ncbi:hypothetical protein Q3G72_004911 [Acer saccharum]|nr:hypothetical protein Q3G72_004911 [Acer saccharum]
MSPRIEESITKDGNRRTRVRTEPVDNRVTELAKSNGYISARVDSHILHVLYTSRDVRIGGLSLHQKLTWARLRTKANITVTTWHLFDR